MKYVGFNTAGDANECAFIIHENYDIYYAKCGLCVSNTSKLLFKHYTEVLTLPKEITWKFLLLNTESNITIPPKYEDLPSYRKIIHINMRNIYKQKNILTVIDGENKFTCGNIEIEGPCVLKYNKQYPKAKNMTAWVETDSYIKILGETT